MKNALGAFIARQRADVFMSQWELAEQTGLSVSTVSRIENDMGYIPNDDALSKIAKALECDYDHLLDLRGQAAMHSAISEIKEAAMKMSPEQITEMLKMLKKAYPEAFRRTKNTGETSDGAKKEEATAKYYFIRGKTLEDVESMDGDLSSRRLAMCHYEDYPRHKHESYGLVEVMELITEKRYRDTRYMSESKTHFSSICLPKSAIITVDGKKYIRDFEEQLGTMVWQRYLWEQEEKSKKRANRNKR